MAVGDVTDLGKVAAIQLLAAATATNGPPTAITHGVEINELIKQFSPRRGIITVASTAGSDTMSCTLRAWGYGGMSGTWIPPGIGTGSAKGLLNAGASIGETGTDMIRHAEPVEDIMFFRRVYLEIVAIGGTATALSAWLYIYRGGE